LNATTALAGRGPSCMRSDEALRPQGLPNRRTQRCLPHPCVTGAESAPPARAKPHRTLGWRRNPKWREPRSHRRGRNAAAMAPNPHLQHTRNHCNHGFFHRKPRPGHAYGPWPFPLPDLLLTSLAWAGPHPRSLRLPELPRTACMLYPKLPAGRGDGCSVAWTTTVGRAQRVQCPPRRRLPAEQSDEAHSFCFVPCTQGAP
jgi:hypothetical protein